MNELTQSDYTSYHLRRVVEAKFSRFLTAGELASAVEHAPGASERIGNSASVRIESLTSARPIRICGATAFRHNSALVQSADQLIVQDIRIGQVHTFPRHGDHNDPCASATMSPPVFDQTQHFLHGR